MDISHLWDLACNVSDNLRSLTFNIEWVHAHTCARLCVLVLVIYSLLCTYMQAHGD